MESKIQGEVVRDVLYKATAFLQLFLRSRPLLLPRLVLWAVTRILVIRRLVSSHTRREMYASGAAPKQEAGEHVRRNITWGTSVREVAADLGPIERDNEDDEGRIDGLSDWISLIGSIYAYVQGKNDPQGWGRSTR